MEKTTEKIPTWSLCYFINGDTCGLTDEEMRTIYRWCDGLDVQIVSPIEDEDGNMHPYFSHYPAFGSAAEVVDCDILYNRPNNDNHERN